MAAAFIRVIASLLLMFPADVSAALNGIPFRGEPPTPSWLRPPMQILFIGALWWSSIRAPHHRLSRASYPQPT
jgi:hypothetical protein